MLLIKSTTPNPALLKQCCVELEVTELHGGAVAHSSSVFALFNVAVVFCTRAFLYFASFGSRCPSREAAAHWCNPQAGIQPLHSLEMIYLVDELHICLCIVTFLPADPIFVSHPFKKSECIVVTHALLLGAYLYGSGFYVFKSPWLGIFTYCKGFKFSLSSKLQGSSVVSFSLLSFSSLAWFPFHLY